jgi:Zn-finger nucleic acid-binding protein
MVMKSDSSPKCPNCNRSFQPGKEKCMWCGEDLSGVEVPSMQLVCPICKIQLSEYKDKGWLLHVCSGCRGVWIGSRVFERFEKMYENTKPLPATEKEGHVEKAKKRIREGIKDRMSDKPFKNCPQCGNHMARKKYKKISYVIIDECIGHGVWFDEGEFQSVLQFLQEGGLVKSRQLTTESSDKHKAFQKTITKMRSVYRLF